MAALRNRLSGGIGPLPDDRELAERHVERVTLTPDHIELHLRQCVQDAEAPEAAGDASDPPGHPRVTTITIPWTSPIPAAVKGIIHVPAHSTPMTPTRREALLIAIAKARNWVDDLTQGRAASLAASARREGKVERHVRLLAPLAGVAWVTAPGATRSRGSSRPSSLKYVGGRCIKSAGSILALLACCTPLMGSPTQRR